jgi:hypothetical protein
VYVMWRLDPESTIAVWVKSNPDQHVHSECGRHGTSTVSPERTRPLPPVWAGEPLSHTLRAQIIGDMLLVFADGSLVWRGLLPAEVVRTHNPQAFIVTMPNWNLSLRSGRLPPAREFSPARPAQYPTNYSSSGTNPKTPGLASYRCVLAPNTLLCSSTAYAQHANARDRIRSGGGGHGERMRSDISTTS